jgi:uncharacterized protein (DUF362 family)
MPEPSTVLATAFRDDHDVLELLGSLGVPDDVSSAALKLNLCEYRRAESGATTSLRVVEAVVVALRRLCPSLRRVVLLEHDSSGTRASDLFALLGFADLAHSLDCELFVPDNAKWRSCGEVAGLPVELPELAWDVDLFVNIPKLKYHGKTLVTGALKNNFGLIKRKWKAPYHAHLDQTIVASNSPLPRQLVVTDGTSTFSGRGPSYGIPMRPEVLLASWDPVAADSAQSRLLGIPPQLVRHLRLASRAGLGTTHSALRWRGGRAGLGERPRFDWIRFLAASAARQ